MIKTNFTTIECYIYSIIIFTFSMSLGSIIGMTIFNDYTLSYFLACLFMGISLGLIFGTLTAIKYKFKNENRKNN